jgi:AAA family ATP:ADP antiporter
MPSTPATPTNNSPLYDEEYEDAPINQGLLTRKRKSLRDRSGPSSDGNEWMRPYWMGSALFLILFAFWLLDSLKDPLFARLVDGKFETHQPTAKLCSVATTLLLVCLMEYLANLRQRQAAQTVTHDHEILDPGGSWRRIPMDKREHRHALDDTVSITIFTQIGVPYVIAFAIIAYLVRAFEAVEEGLPEGFDVWYILAYVLYATIESFGSISVATFWSFANSTLNLTDAERYYGMIIAIAQLGAIGGSTLVASDHWKAPSLLVVVSLAIVLQMLLMKVYDRRFKPTSVLANDHHDDEASLLTWQDDDVTLTKPFWSGLYLIIRHHYVLLILGVSCLYEITLTCLDYQMKLLGYARFELNENVTMSFSEFMGRYGMMVNVTSLFFSSMIFPWLIQRYGLRVTLRVFPSLLLLVTIIAYGFLPGNLVVLFFSLSMLKAMTYSVHDPAKEILYIPTSNAVKFRAKFWIDIVGERISKAIGSGFNTFAGSVDRSVKLGGLPSIVSAAGLWFVCYYVGIEFDRLLRTGKIVGLEQSVDPTTYKRLSKDELEEREEPDEVEISFGEDSVSTLGILHDPIDDALGNTDTPEGKLIELPPIRPPIRM